MSTDIPPPTSRTGYPGTDPNGDTQGAGKPGGLSTGKAHHADGLSAMEAAGNMAPLNIPPPVASQTEPTQDYFLTGGQVPIESPSAPVDESAVGSLGAKALKLLKAPTHGTPPPPSLGPSEINTGGGGGHAPFILPPDASKDFDIDAVLHLLLAEANTEFKQAFEKSAEDLKERIEALGDSVRDLKKESKSHRLAAALGRQRPDNRRRAQHGRLCHRFQRRMDSQ